MQMFYIANARIPTKKAHGVTIMKSCEALVQAGAAVTLIVPKRRSNCGDPFEVYDLKRNFTIVYLPTVDLFRFERYLGALAFWIQILTFYLSVTVYLLFRSRKTVLYSRDYLSPLLSLFGFPIIFECHHIPRQASFFFLINKLSHKIVTISQALKESYLRRGFHSEEILVAPSGVDLCVFDLSISKEDARRRLKLPNDKIILGYCGNFTTMGEDKGLSWIIETLPQLAEEIILVAAGGDERDRQKYEMLARTKGIGERVYLFSHMSQRELALYQKAADMLLMVFPDTHHYRSHMSPVKMFEYMASQRPIIATNLPTIREVLDEQSALLIDSHEKGALKRAVEKLAEDTALQAKIAQHAYEKVGRYTWEKRAERVLKHIS